MFQDTIGIKNKISNNELLWKICKYMQHSHKKIEYKDHFQASKASV